MDIKLIKPTIAYKGQIEYYRTTFLSEGESMDGTAGLRDATSVEDWLVTMEENSAEETVHEGLVPASTFLAVDQSDELVGMIDIRHRLSPYLLQFGGHIGYSVSKPRRKQGIATNMLLLALAECKTLGIDRVLVTCDKNNVASSKTIVRNGGVLENEVPEGQRITQRYWIEVS